MKKLIALSIFLSFGIMSFAQNLNVATTGITWQYPLESLGDVMVNGSTQNFTIGNTVFPQAMPYVMTLTDTAVEDNIVNVTYNDDSATVLLPGTLAGKLTVKVNGAHVSILQSADVTEEITYNLTGTTGNGSFYMDGDLKSTLVLNNVVLENPDSAAINIQDGKRINVVLEGLNSLTDGITGTNDGSDAHNACFYINGHAEFEGEGWLFLYGKVKHAYASDEYTKFKKSMTGAIQVYEAVGDGMHVGQYFQMNGGFISIECQGDGIDVGAKKDTSLENNGQIIIGGGEIDVETNGASGDAMKCEGAFTQTDGELYLDAYGDGGRLVSADGDVTISGGKLQGAVYGKVNKNDDDRKGHGIKSDGNINVSGGEVLVAASADKGTAFKTDYQVNFTGGTVMGIGGKKTTSTTTTSTYYSGVDVEGPAELTYDGVTFNVPIGYSNSSAYIIVAKN